MDNDADPCSRACTKLQEKGITFGVCWRQQFQASYGNKSGEHSPPDLPRPWVSPSLLWSRSRHENANGQTAQHKMSDFSSWGVFPDMRLQAWWPPGSNIYSSA